MSIHVCDTTTDVCPQCSAVTSTEFEYLSKSTSNWPKSYLSRSKSNAQKVTQVKVKSTHFFQYLESKKVKVKVKVTFL